MDRDYEEISGREARAFFDSKPVGSYNLVDVRQDWEYEEFHLPGSQLIPLPELPDRMNEIDKEKTTVVYCAAGGRSAAAARLLKGQGFDRVFNLLGGIMSWKDEYAVGPKEMGMAAFSGDENPLQILVLAYGMENNLSDFFSRAAASAGPQIKDVLTRLSKFETGHKSRIFSMARQLDPTLRTQADLEKRSHVLFLEGGMSAGEFMEANQEYLKSPRGTIEAAMMVEAQALDLYLRCARRTGRTDSAELLRTLAQDEKGHLAVLGGLMNRKTVQGNDDG